MKDLPRDELNRVAVAFHAGKIWTHLDATSPEELIRQWPILSFMKPAAFKKFAKEVGLIYEYIDKAAGGINGKPMFFSCRTMNKADLERLRVIVANLDKAQKAALEENVTVGAGAKKPTYVKRVRAAQKRKK